MKLESGCLISDTGHLLLAHLELDVGRSMLDVRLLYATSLNLTNLLLEAVLI
jgi:hypothetical protein